MTPITTRDERTIDLPTAYGDVRVLFHDDASAYVTFGAQGSSPDLPPLKLPRGVELRGSAHYRRPVSDITGHVSGSWRPAGTHTTAYQYFYRGSNDATPKMGQTAREAIIDALDTWSATDTGRGMLDTLRQLKAHGDASEYRERAIELRQLADDCNEYAAALLAGGRARYRVLELTSGAEEHVRMVQLPGEHPTETNRGQWLNPLQEVSMPYGTTKYDPTRGIRGHHENDR
jgi:hypothetical protein